MNIEIGQKAPAFTLPESDWKSISLSDFEGNKNVVLYFYPKDDTPGCTKEACGFRDNISRLNDEETVVLGISKDSLKSHDKFKEKYELPFPLLSDETGKVCELYDVWKEKSMYGKKYMGIERSTFLIDKKGILQAIWREVKVEGHVDEILEKLQTL